MQSNLWDANSREIHHRFVSDLLDISRTVNGTTPGDRT
jgi:hypothetical protein